MDDSRVKDLLRSIAISSGLLGTTAISQEDRIVAFNVLEQFKRYDHKSSNGLNAARSVVAVSIELLSRNSHLLYVDNVSTDVTTPTKLYALGCIIDFVATRFYTDALTDADRAALRQAVLTAAKQLILEPPSSGHDAVKGSRRIIASKISTVLANFAVRDFPQRWMMFAAEVLATTQNGGLWNNVDGEGVGTKICLECLTVIIENCTDSDFNSKISTTRRNDVLTGLNEISSNILQPMFSLMAEEYAIVVSTRQTLFQMEEYLVKNGRSMNQMTDAERSQYVFEKTKQALASNLIAQSLITMEKFCHYMPIEWATTTDRGYDFISVFLHFLREPSLQVLSIYCLEAVAIRKLDFGPWFRLISTLPQAINEANNNAVTLNNNDISSSSQSLLVAQLPYHKELSKMLSLILSAHIAHITNDKEILQGQGEKYRSFASYMRLMTDMLSHPSGRVCGEQTNLWLAFLRDPQIASTSTTITPYLREVLVAFMTHVVRIRWSDVEEGIHQFSSLLECSWDDIDAYELWLMELRSKTSFLFKSIAYYEPVLAASAINAKIQEIIATRGSGELRDHVDPRTNRLTEVSEANLQFEGVQPAFDNILQGIPDWALIENGPASVGGRSVEKTTEIRNTVRAHLSQLANAIVSWVPTDVWLRLRRVTLLQTLRYFWKHEPSTLAAGIDALLVYLDANDEWNGATENNYAQSQNKLSEEVVGLRKKSGCALISVSKQIPTLLLPWLSQLSDRARTLLSSENILNSNRMHLYEFLSCVANAIEDSKLRAKFIADVLSESLNVLNSPMILEATSSIEGFMNFLGVTEAGINRNSVTNIEHVSRTTQNFARFYSAFNQLLSVGRRCSEAAKMRPNGGIPLFHHRQILQFTDDLQPFPDEGPVAISVLSNDDPFVPLWPKFLPVFLRTLDVLFRMWHPEYQARYLCNDLQRFVYSISDDEVYLARKQDNADGGVFGEGGTAGSVVSGWSRKDKNLLPRWSGWLNELRNACLQLLGLLAAQRVLFAPDLSSSFPGIVTTLADVTHLRAMEHRHMTQYILPCGPTVIYPTSKQFAESLLLSCPFSMYGSHLSPLLAPLFENIQYRLQLTWAPILNANDNQNINTLTAPLNTSTCTAALAAGRDGDWYAASYARGGLFVGDLDSVAAESVVEKVRVDLTRAFCDMLQGALALKGEWGLVLANQAKEESATKSKDPSKLVSAPKTQINLGNNGERRNADGTVRSANQSAIEARQLVRINGLCHFLLLEDERIAGNLVSSVIQCLGFPDAYTCRRCTRICHRILETVTWVERYTNLLGQQMFTQALKLIVKEPKWMIGIEWNMMAVARDIYCRLVLGQFLQAGGQGSAMQQPRVDPNGEHCVFEQSKYVNAPLQGGGILCKPSELPQQILAELPGMTTNDVLTLNSKMTESLTVKDQKDVLREFLRVGAENLQQMEASDDGLALFGRAISEESVLNQKVRAAAVPDIPEKLFTARQAIKKAEKYRASVEAYTDNFGRDLFQDEDNV